MGTRILHNNKPSKTMRLKRVNLAHISLKHIGIVPPTKEEAGALLTALDKCDSAAQSVLEGMKANLRLLREAHSEAEAAREILSVSNAFALAEMRRMERDAQRDLLEEATR